MKNFISIFCILGNSLLFSQNINVKDYGATGNGIKDDTPFFLKAINDINQKYASKNKHSVLYIPSGIYLISKPIVLNKYISVMGEFVNNTVLRTKSTDTELIIFEKNYKENEIYNGYNYFKNISLQGPDYKDSNDPFKNRTVGSEVKKSVGIKVYGLRTRIEDVQIEGFLNSGIEIRGSYYTFIKNNFIINNGIGVLIDDISTSVYLTNSELRHNSIAVVINGHSFANFINNNMIESNVTNFKSFDKSTTNENIFSGGRGIVIKDASHNIVNNNYFENHFVNITVDNGNKNIFSNNFITLSDNTLNAEKNQVSFQLLGNSTNNIFENNSTFPTKENINPNKILIGNGNYSSNYINIGEDNKKLKIELQKSTKEVEKLPKIHD